MIFVASLILMLGCEKKEIEQQPIQPSDPKGNLKALKVVPLIAGRTQNIGNVIVIDDELGFNISIISYDWEFVENHIYIDSMPPSSPAPGQFPYSGTMLGPNSIQFNISFEELGASCGDFYLAVHAEVVKRGNSKGAWAIPDEGAMHWYNPAGKKIGWGAYFNYPINCVQSISVTETADPLETIQGRVKYRNFSISGFDEEINLWPNEGTFGQVLQDFEIGVDCYGNYYSNGQYLFFPASNHISLAYYSIGMFQSIFEATHDFCLYVFPQPNAGIEAIQFMLKKGTANTEVILKNITINGNPVDGIYFGDADSPRWNLTGNILDAGGGFVFEADLELVGESADPESNLVEVTFGMQ